jgi:hypothetical protein
VRHPRDVRVQAIRQDAVIIFDLALEHSEGCLETFQELIRGLPLHAHMGTSLISQV